MPEIKVKRAYEQAEEGDGFRIYVDRLWPRGLSHETFPYDLWDKDVAPSNELRHWFHEDPAGRWKEFREKYMAELAANPLTPRLWKIISAHKTVTLLYSSKDETHNNADILLDYLKDKYGA